MNTDLEPPSGFELSGLKICVHLRFEKTQFHKIGFFDGGKIKGCGILG
jgi:hypothetical protein